MSAYAMSARIPRPGGYGKRSRVMGAVPTNGYPSKLEAAVGAWLELREKNGEISALRRQASIVLQDGPRETRITWRVDFAYFDERLKQDVLAEAKGFATEIYRIKLKLFKGNPTCRLEIWGGTCRNPKIIEIVERK